jgi:hypothetical protein
MAKNAMKPPKGKPAPMAKPGKGGKSSGKKGC